MTQRERHFAGEASDVVVGVSVSADGTGVMAHAGSIAVRLLADGGEAIADINALRHQG